MHELAGNSIDEEFHGKIGKCFQDCIQKRPNLNGGGHTQSMFNAKMSRALDGETDIRVSAPILMIIILKNCQVLVDANFQYATQVEHVGEELRSHMDWIKPAF